MSAHVILDVAQLGKRLTAGCTLEHLILAPSPLVQMLRLPKSNMVLVNYAAFADLLSLPGRLLEKVIWRL